MLMIIDHLMMMMRGHRDTETKIRSIYHYETLIIRHVRSVAGKRTEGSCNKIFEDIKCD
jgi:hypothetical protein